MTREQLIIELEKVCDNDFEMVEGQSLEALMEGMMIHIGDTDPAVRDGLVCDCFYAFLSEDEWFSVDTLKTMLNRLLSETHLFYDIANPGDAVYTRTFSALVIGQLLEKQIRMPYLSTEELDALALTLERYAKTEKNLSGYSEEKGWAHGAAHMADAMEALARCPELSSKGLHAIRGAVDAFVNNGLSMLSHEEDERLARTVIALTRHENWQPQDLTTWFEQLAQNTSGVADMTLYRNRVNTKNLVRSLYFKSVHFGFGEALTSACMALEKSINRYVKIDADKYN